MDWKGLLLGGLIAVLIFSSLTSFHRRHGVRPRDRKALFVFGTLLLLCALGMVGERYLGINPARRVDEWPQVAGTVTESKLTAVVRYSYTVDGAQFSSEQVTPHGDDNAWVRKFRPGTRVNVQYNPANPAQAVLESGRGAADGIMWAMGMTGLSMIVFAVRMPEK